MSIMEDTQIMDYTQDINADLEDESENSIVAWVEIEHRKYELREGSMKLGRDPSTCQIVLHNQKTISKEHALFEVDKSFVTLTDLGSRNKTKIGKMALRPHLRYALQAQEELKFGAVKGCFIINTQDTDTDSDACSESMLDASSSTKQDISAASNSDDGKEDSIISPTPQTSTKPLNALGKELTSKKSLDFVPETPTVKRNSSSNIESRETVVMESPTIQSTPCSTPQSTLKNFISPSSSVYLSPITVPKKSWLIRNPIIDDNHDSLNGSKKSEPKPSEGKDGALLLASFRNEKKYNSDKRADVKALFDKDKIKCNFKAPPSDPYHSKHNEHYFLGFRDEKDDTQDILQAFKEPSKKNGDTSQDSTQDILEAFEKPTDTLQNDEFLEAETQPFDRTDSGTIFKRPVVMPLESKLKPAIKASNFDRRDNIFDAPTQQFLPSSQTSCGGDDEDTFNMPIQLEASAKNFETPTQVFEAPTQLFEAPTQLFEAPTQVFEAPTQVFDAPTQVFDAPTQVFDAPTQVFDAPTQVFDAPTQVFDAPTQVFDAPTQVFDAPTQIFDPPTQICDTPQSPSNLNSLSEKENHVKSNSFLAEVHNEATLVFNGHSPTAADGETSRKEAERETDDIRYADTVPIINSTPGLVCEDKSQSTEELIQVSHSSKFKSKDSTPTQTEDDTDSVTSESLLEEKEEYFEETVVFSHSQLTPNPDHSNKDSEEKEVYKSASAAPNNGESELDADETVPYIENEGKSDDEESCASETLLDDVSVEANETVISGTTVLKAKEEVKINVVGESATGDDYNTDESTDFEDNNPPLTSRTSSGNENVQSSKTNRGCKITPENGYNSDESTDVEERDQSSPTPTSNVNSNFHTETSHVDYNTDESTDVEGDGISPSLNENNPSSLVSSEVVQNVSKQESDILKLELTGGSDISQGMMKDQKETVSSKGEIDETTNFTSPVKKVDVSYFTPKSSSQKLRPDTEFSENPILSYSCFEFVSDKKPPTRNTSIRSREEDSPESRHKIQERSYKDDERSYDNTIEGSTSKSEILFPLLSESKTENKKEEELEVNLTAKKERKGRNLPSPSVAKQLDFGCCQTEENATKNSTLTDTNIDQSECQKTSLSFADTLSSLDSTEETSKNLIEEGDSGSSTEECKEKMKDREETSGERRSKSNVNISKNCFQDETCQTGKTETLWERISIPCDDSTSAHKSLSAFRDSGMQKNEPAKSSLDSKEKEPLNCLVPKMQMEIRSHKKPIDSKEALSEMKGRRLPRNRKEASSGISTRSNKEVEDDKMQMEIRSHKKPIDSKEAHTELKGRRLPRNRKEASSGISTRSNKEVEDDKMQMEIRSHKKPIDSKEAHTELKGRRLPRNRKEASSGISTRSNKEVEDDKMQMEIRSHKKPIDSKEAHSELKGRRLPRNRKEASSGIGTRINKEVEDDKMQMEIRSHKKPIDSKEAFSELKGRRLTRNRKEASSGICTGSNKVGDDKMWSIRASSNDTVERPLALSADTCSLRKETKKSVANIKSKLASAKKNMSKAICDSKTTEVDMAKDIREVRGTSKPQKQVEGKAYVYLSRSDNIKRPNITENKIASKGIHTTQKTIESPIKQEKAGRMTRVRKSTAPDRYSPSKAQTFSKDTCGGRRMSKRKLGKGEEKDALTSKKREAKIDNTFKDISGTSLEKVNVRNSLEVCSEENANDQDSEKKKAKTFHPGKGSKRKKNLQDEKAKICKKTKLENEDVASKSVFFTLVKEIKSKSIPAVNVVTIDLPAQGRQTRRRVILESTKTSGDRMSAKNSQRLEGSASYVSQSEAMSVCSSSRSSLKSKTEVDNPIKRDSVVRMRRRTLKSECSPMKTVRTRAKKSTGVVENEMEISTISDLNESQVNGQGSRQSKKRMLSPPKSTRSSARRRHRESYPSFSKEVVLWSPSQRQAMASKRPRVLFTGFKDNKDEKIVKDFGGILVETAIECSVLVTNDIKRTCKFMACLGKGIPIVSTEWIFATKQARNFVDPWDYLVCDNASEKKFGFSLKQTLKMAEKKRLLSGYSIYVTDSVKPSPEEMREIVVCAGGEYLETAPVLDSAQTLVISCPQDKSSWNKFKKLKISVVNTEFILTGLLRQKILIEENKLA